MHYYIHYILHITTNNTRANTKNTKSKEHKTQTNTNKHREAIKSPNTLIINLLLYFLYF